MRLDGVTDLCAQPDPDTWTCRAATRGGRLPDVAALERAVTSAGEQFSLRGVEVEAVGTVRAEPGGLVLEMDGTEEKVRLQPVTRRIEWSFRAQRAPPLSDEERAAWSRLRAGQRVRLAGPYAGGALEVRRFEPLPLPAQSNHRNP